MSTEPDSLRADSDEYRRILINSLPLIDVRAPAEFAQGAFPAAINLPLMLDSERHSVGLCYKQHGQAQALALGQRLVSAEIREQRLARWHQHCLAHPEGYLYCFRGGLRSHTVQEWLKQSGIHYPLVIGGYKALRRFMLETLRQAAALPITLIGGNTGCGKTLLVKELTAAVDLEGIAHHRGSSFGRTLTPQNTQIDFEHRLAIVFLAQQQAGVRRWILEDEGHTIGSNHIPLDLYNSMQQAPVVVIDDPFTTRLQRLREEYIDQMWVEFQQCYGEQQGWQEYSAYLHHGLFAIRRRLGMERYQRLATLLDAALQSQQQKGDSEQHIAWLVPLLKNYYDPMYTYQLAGKAQRIVFRGTYAEVKQYLATRTAH